MSLWTVCDIEKSLSYRTVGLVHPPEPDILVYMADSMYYAIRRRAPFGEPHVAAVSQALAAESLRPIPDRRYQRANGLGAVTEPKLQLHTDHGIRSAEKARGSHVI